MNNQTIEILDTEANSFGTDTAGEIIEISDDDDDADVAGNIFIISLIII